MFLFGKKKSAKKGIPVDLVKELSSKGLSEPEIVSILRRQGYSPSQIEKALAETLKTTISSHPLFGSPQKQQPLEQNLFGKKQNVNYQQTQTHPFSRDLQQKFSITEPNTLPTLQTIPSAQPSQLPQREFIPPQPQPPPQNPARIPSFSPPAEKIEKKESEKKPEEEEFVPFPDLTLEEVIEGIIADKWTSFETIIEELRRKDDDLQRQIIDLRKEIDAVKDEIRKSEERFIAKLEEHGSHVTSIEARIGSIERIFKEFIPELTETMRIVKEIVEKKKESETL